VRELRGTVLAGYGNSVHRKRARVLESSAFKSVVVCWFKWRLVLMALALCALGSWLGLACSGPSEQEARGILVDVQSREIVNADAVTLRDETGASRTFRVSPEVASNPEHPNTASHLRQHMAAGDPVIVRFRDSPDGLLAVLILDAAPSSQATPRP